MQLVVVMAVMKAVRAATMTFTAISRIRFFFSSMVYLLSLLAFRAFVAAAAALGEELGADRAAHLVLDGDGLHGGGRAQGEGLGVERAGDGGRAAVGGVVDAGVVSGADAHLGRLSEGRGAADGGSCHGVGACRRATVVAATRVASRGVRARRGAVAVSPRILCLVFGHCRGDGREGLHRAGLAVDGDLLGVDDIAELQGAGVLEGWAAEVVELGGVGQEADVDGLHHVVWAEAHHFGDAAHAGALHHLCGGIEGAESFELHRHALCHQLGQVVDNLLQHALDDVALVDGAMRDHVVAEAAQREGGLAVHRGVILAVACATFVLVLSEVDPHCNLFSCHNK